MLKDKGPDPIPKQVISAVFSIELGTKEDETSARPTD